MKNLEIKYFRCFDSLKVNFTPGVNLLIGDNASGKTSLLMACKYAASCFFSGFSDNYTSWKTPGTNDFTRLYINEKKAPVRPIEIGFEFFDGELAADSLPNLQHAQLLYKKTENSRPLVSTLSELRDYGKFLYENFVIADDSSNEIRQQYPLPLIASYSTHGIHKKTKINGKYFIDYHQTPSFGYYLCGETDGLTEYWVRRLLALKEADKNPVERQIVTGSLCSMFGEEGCNLMRGFDLRIISKDIYCQLNDGREVASSLLSDGYMRLFSIVLDLAFRCALLNGEIYGAEAALRTRGSVIIDEIDLHLHPSLQTVVLKGLQHTFPSLQFIVSTHAPMVMSGVDTTDINSVMQMKYDTEENRYDVKAISTYGMDLSTISRTVLNVSPRVSEVEDQLQSLSDFISNDKLEEAKALLAEMQSRYGDRLPELAGMETEINFEEALR